MNGVQLEEKIKRQVSRIIDEEIEERLKSMDLYDVVEGLNNKIAELEEENEKLKSLEPGWQDFLILFLPVLFGGLVGSFLGVLIYNLL